MERTGGVGVGGGPAQDQWARWLLRERFGGSTQQRDRVMAFLEPVRDRVLAGAALAPGDRVLDVGCGDGLLGMAALDRVGPSGQVIFSDLSLELVEHCHQLAQAAGVAGRCRFQAASLPELAGIEDAAVDAAVLRSVLIYVPDKPSAVQHLHRVLRPGGRLSLFEPVNSFGFPEPAGWLWGFDMSGLESLAEAVQAVYAAHAGPAGTDPMLGFDERDLLEWARQAGFADLALVYEAQVQSRHPFAGGSLETLLDTAPNPRVPTFRQMLHEALDEADQAAVEQRMSARLAVGAGRTRQAVAYLTGQRASP